MSEQMQAEVGGSRGTGWRERLDGLVPQAIERRSVLVVGCGSVGSSVAMQLVRSGLRRITLIDPDRVEWPNLTRTTYGHRDVGRLKVDALSDGLKAVFPDLDVATRAIEVQRIGEEWRALLEPVDLVVAAVDAPAANGFVNRHCYALGKPVVFIGLYKGAKGGEIVVTRGGATPCLNCSTGGVRQLSDDLGSASVVRERRDYGTNRLVAEVALGSDIHFVCNAATKVALSLMAGDDPSSPLGGFATRQIEQGCNYIMFGMEPDYFIFPATHGKAEGQYAFQSVWARTSANPQCTVCGEAGYREDPFARSTP